jgi:hypothetical protein
VEEAIALPGRDLAILRPRDSEALLDDDAFEHEEFLPYWAELWPSGGVLATDWSPDATRLARENAARNGIELEVLTCAWAEPEPLEARGPWDLILGADLLYERRNVGELLRLFPRLAGPRTEILLADPGRAPLEEFLTGAAERFTVTRGTARELPNGAIYALTSPMRPAARGS